MLATGLVGAAGYLFRRNLLHAMRNVTQETVKAVAATSNLADGARQQTKESADAFLHHIGLEQRTSLLGSLTGPVLGVAFGFIAGAATYFFAPRLLAQLGIGGAPENDLRSPENAQRTEKRASGTADGILDHGTGDHLSG